MTWKLFQETNGVWVQEDARDTAKCAPVGAQQVSDFATCVVGRRFLVEYVIVVKGDGSDWGFTAISGGGESDVCEAGRDVTSKAMVQFATVTRRQDHVCGAEELAEEWAGTHGYWLSAVWMKPPDCGTAGRPGSFCQLSKGEVRTDDHGLDDQGQSNYVFNLLDSARPQDLVYYVAFDPDFRAQSLGLESEPWVTGHHSGGEEESFDGQAVTSFRFDETSTGPRHVGFVRANPMAPAQTQVAWDPDADCDGPITGGRLHEQEFENPSCLDGTASQWMDTRAGTGSGFTLVYECGSNEFHFVPCDALLTSNAQVCDPSLVF